MVGIIGGTPGGSTSALFIRNILLEELAKISETEGQALAHAADVGHGGIVLRGDDNITEKTIKALPSCVLSFHPKLKEALCKEHGADGGLQKLRGLLLPALKEMVSMAVSTKSGIGGAVRRAQEAGAEVRQEMDRQITQQQKLDAFYLIDELTKRVEKLEAKR